MMESHDPIDRDDVFDETAVARFARLALDAVHREYPNKIAHVLASPSDVGEPHELTPAFYGSFDWHSSVHGHWLLARLCRLHPEAPFVAEARAALARSLTPANIAAECEYLDAPGRGSFERPYGLAWLLQLALELRQWDDPQAAAWSRALAPLESLAAERFHEWMPKLTHPIRTGEHSQTAFAMGLVLDWARGTDDREMVRLMVERGREFYFEDAGWNLAFEPGGQDFLSPGLAEADFMRRILAPEAFADWLEEFLPGLPTRADGDWLPVGIVTDKSDGKLAHLDGLNLSRAWMLDGILDGLPPHDARRLALHAARTSHAEAGLAAVTGEDYAGGHWLGSFAVYLVTKRGISR